MSLENIPGFAPIINTVLQPLPQFLVTYFIRSAPYVVLSLATLMSYTDFFKGVSQSPSILLGPRDTDAESYDFIVVGGGSSGAVIASRLSQNFRVLLVEAGGDPHPLTYIPAFGSSLYNKPQVDWEYRSTYLNGSGLGSPDGRVKVPRSKSLGGSTNVNDMIYMRGNPNDYNAWVTATLDPKWGYPKVREYFKKMEDYHGHWASTEGNDHGIGGPIHIEKSGFAPSVKYWLDAGSEMGFKNSDPNDQQSEGFFQLDVMAQRGIRYGTYRGYLEKNLNNPNLVIHRYSIVTQIHFDENKRAEGISYYRHAIKQTARATKEIILSAGAINTPKLLLLSGIGPKDELDSVGIDQLVELPVGKNLQDHVSTIIGPFLLNKSESFLASRDISAISAGEYLSRGTGPFSVANWISASAVLSTSSSSPLSPNIMFNLIGAGTDSILARHLADTYSLDSPLISSFMQSNAKMDSNYVIVSLGKPRSRGSVTIGSFDPWHEPRINLNYYSDLGGKDLKDMVEAVQMAVSIYENTTSFQHLGAHLAKEKYPGCEQHEMRSESYWECLIRTVTVTLSSPCCTAPMGLPGIGNAVVDSQLKVMGVSGLRIGDASVMPEITNAHLNAPTIMIGEVCSDLIINDWPEGKENIVKN